MKVFEKSINKLLDLGNYFIFDWFEAKYSKYAGLIYMLFASICGSLVALFVKYAGDVPSFQKTFMRAFVMYVLNSALLIHYGENPYPSDFNRLKPLLLRGISGVIGSASFVYAVSTINLSEALVLTYTSPI